MTGQRATENWVVPKRNLRILVISIAVFSFCLGLVLGQVIR